MRDDAGVVIVGAGFTGGHAAAALRREGFDGRIVVVGDELVRPYDRVTLSKHYLYDEPGFHGLYLEEPDFYDAHGIELALDADVTAIDPGRRDVVLASGRRFRYDALLLATGAEPIRWRGRGFDLAGVHYLRTLADADSLKAAFAQAASRGGSVVVVGGGWIGCEIAASAWKLGLPVAMVTRSALLLERQLGPEMAAFYQDLHLKHGIEIHSGKDVAALSGPGRVEDVVLTDGSVLPADVVIFGIGASPRTHLATPAGITTQDGIVTDEYFRTSVPGIFAAGDVASVRNLALDGHYRPGHWAAALHQGPAAARSMLGRGEPYRDVPFFFSDQFDVWMEYTGEHRSDDELLIRGRVAAGEFIAFWLRDGRLAAGMNVNIKGVPDAIRGLIALGAPLDREKLVDPAIPLPETILAA